MPTFLLSLKKNALKIIAGIAVILLLGWYIQSLNRDIATLQSEVTSTKEKVIDSNAVVEFEQSKAAITDTVTTATVEEKEKLTTETKTIIVEVEKTVERIIQSAPEKNHVPAVTHTVVNGMWNQYCLLAKDDPGCTAESSPKASEGSTTPTSR
jgi:hypothetical protein